MNAGRLSKRGKGLFVALAASAAALAAFLPGAGHGGVSAYDPGDIIVADANHDAIKAVDPVSGVATPVTSGGSMVFPADVTFASDGDTLVVDRDAFGDEPNGGIIRIDSVTGIQSTVSNNHISSQAGGKKLFGNPIALDRKGNSLYVVDFHKPHKMFKVNIDTGKASLVAEARGMPSPSDVLAAGVAKPLVAATGPDVTELLEINPKTGNQSVVSKNGKFEFPSGLIPDGSNSVLVTDPGPSAIFKVNLDSGKQKTLVQGPPLTSPIGIARIDSHTVAVSDIAAPSFPTGGIYRVDLDTGDQTLLNGSAFNNPLGIDVAP